MARKQSVILTPTEKRAAVADAKARLQAAKSELATLTKGRKGLDIQYAKEVKASDKELAAAQKVIAAAEAELLKINPPKAASSPVGM